MAFVETRKLGRFIFIAVLAVLALAAAGGLYFIYAVVPPKVAQSIVAKGQVRQPLTESPKDYGVKDYRDVSFVTDDGVTLAGWWLPVKRPAKPIGTVLLTHGVFKNRQQVLSRALFCSKLGYQALLFDMRGMGQSGNSAVSGGLLEAGDYLAAEKYLESRHQLVKPVIFFGFSLGSMAALRAGVKSPDVDAVIADSPLANLKSYVSRRTMGGNFASLPGFLNACLKNYDLLTGLHLTENDMDLTPVVEQLKQPAVLYITGESDDLAKSKEVQQLFSHTPSPHRRLVYIPDSGHEETFKKFPLIYEKEVRDFLTDLKNGFPKPEEELKDH